MKINTTWRTAAGLHSELLQKHHRKSIFYFADTQIHNIGKIYKFGITNNIRITLTDLNCTFGTHCQLTDAIDISNLNYHETDNVFRAARKYFSCLDITYPMVEIKDTIRVGDLAEVLKLSHTIREGVIRV